MDDLDSRMQRVLDVARQGMSPRAADTERTRRTLLAATAGLAVGAGTSSAAGAASAGGVGAAGAAAIGKGAVVTAASSLSLGTKIVAVAAVSAVLGSAGFLATHESAPDRSPAAPLAAPAKVSVAPAPIVTAPTQASAVSAPAAETAPAVQPVAPPRLAAPASKNPGPDPLKAELALIEQARQALKSDNPRQALVALDAHRARFERGVMAQERSALRALALCSLADPRGREQAQRFIEQNPGSPLSAHLRAGCK